MFREIVPIAIALFIALVGGIYSANSITNEFEGFGTLTYGSWTAWPNIGTADADPYSRARGARTGRIALGSAEGLIFVARLDESEQPIIAECSYTIEGTTPPARYWTLRIVNEQLYQIESADNVHAVASDAILRKQDGSFAISISNIPTAGNWLQSSGAGPRSLILTLYDTSVATTTGVAEIVMPKIERIGCNFG